MKGTIRRVRAFMTVGTREPSTELPAPVPMQVWSLTLQHKANPDNVNSFTIIAESESDMHSMFVQWIDEHFGEGFPLPTEDVYSYNRLVLMSGFALSRKGVIAFTYVW